MTLARLGEHMNVDLWHYETPDGRSIRKALDYLMPFGVNGIKWPYQQIDGWSADLFIPCCALQPKISRWSLSQIAFDHSSRAARQPQPFVMSRWTRQSPALRSNLQSKEPD